MNRCLFHRNDSRFSRPGRERHSACQSVAFPSPAISLPVSLPVLAPSLRGCSVNQTASRVRLLYARDVFRSSEAAAVALEEMRVDARRVQLGFDAPQAHRRMTGGAGPAQHPESGRTVGPAKSSIGHGRIPPGLTQETGSAGPRNGRPEELRRAAVSASL